jgi:outer membrane protein assembly factor BamD (BamD/ComL family)
VESVEFLRPSGSKRAELERATAEEWYERGNAFRKESKWHEAINCYIQAIELDPDSPAVEAKRMLDDIMAFYCKDMYNP